MSLGTMAVSVWSEHTALFRLTQETFILIQPLHVRWRPRLLSRYSDLLRAGRSGDRMPVEARLSAPVQTGPGVHPTSCTMGTGGEAAGAWC